MVSPVKLVAVAAFPVILPAMGLVTVKFANVPTLVKLEPVTVDLIVVPVHCSADAPVAIVISALPSNATPLMVFEAANLVAVAALPVVF